MTTLKGLRKSAGLSVQEAAKRSGVPLRNLYRYEQECSTPSAQYIAPLAKLYNVPAETILSLFADKKAAGHAVSFLNLAIAAAMLAVGLLAIELTMPALGSF